MFSRNYHQVTHLFVGVRRLPDRPDGYGMTDNALEIQVEKTFGAAASTMFQKEREMDAAPERERAPTVQSVTNIHVHGGQVGNLLTGGLVHGGVESTQNTAVLDDADAWEGLVDIGKQEFQRCQKIAEQEEEQLRTLTSAQTSAQDPGAIYSSHGKFWRYRCIEFDVAKFAAQGQPYLDIMEKQAYDLAALFANEENLIGCKTGAGSITMKGTFANQTEEMDAVKTKEEMDALDAPQKQSPPQNDSEKVCTLTVSSTMTYATMITFAPVVRRVLYI
jgi:hypothetical protein